MPVITANLQAYKFKASLASTVRHNKKKKTKNKKLIPVSDEE